MGFFGKLFGSSDVVEKGLSVVDAAFYTDEERAEMKERILKAYEPFKLAQRLLALMFSAVFLVLLVFLVVLSFFCDISDQIKIIAQYMSSEFTTPIMIILAFYFGGGAAEGIISRIKDDRE